MRVAGWAADQAGCGAYRLGYPLRALAGRGYETLASTQLPAEWWDADVIIGQRVCMPAPSQLWQRLAAEGRTLVYEADDDLFSVDRSSGAWATFSRPDVQDRIVANAAAASWVSVSTEPLAEVFGRIHPDVRVVPNCVPADLLTHARPRAERLTVGWAGSATHAMDWEELTGPLRQFLVREPDVDLHVMGAPYGHWLRLPADRCRFTPWMEDLASFHRAIDFDVAVAPLRPHVFNRSKSAIKAIEAAALGIPMVASDVGPYPDVVEHGVTGFLVRRPHEWGRYLRELVHDDAMRAAMGAAARERATAWTVEGNVDNWVKAWGL